MQNKQVEKMGVRKILGLTALIASLLVLSYGTYLLFVPVVTASYTNYTVVRTGDTFVPPLLIVPLGATVTFTSNQELPYWPASDLHPSHDIFSDFDPKRALLGDESWSFTFNEQGQWLYHDHLASYAGGSIFVVTSPLDPIGIECDSSANEVRCWSQLLAKVVSENNLSSAFALVERLYTQSPNFAVACHNLTHDIGVKAYARYKDNVPILPESRYCNAGFYHGYMEGLLNDVFRPSEGVAFCTRVGATLKDTFPRAEDQCRHGIGHGALENIIRLNSHRWEEPASLLEESLAICDEANATFDTKFRCASGASSVLHDWALSEKTLRPYMQQNGIAICKNLEHDWAQQACIWEFSKKVTGFFEDDHYLQTFTLLQKELPKESKELAMAIRSVSIILGKHNTKEPTDDTVIHTCKELPSHLQSACIEGVVEGFLFAGEPKDEFTRALTFCADPRLTTQEQNLCFDTITEFAKETQEKIVFHAICNQTPETKRKEEICESS